MANGNTINTRTALTAVTVTPSDSTEFSPLLDALYVGTAGNVTLIDSEGTSVVFLCSSGAILPVTTSMVMSTGTTASNIVGLRY